MRDVTDIFQTTYHPVKALLIYRQRAGQESTYIEAFDIDEQTGKPINAHPLSESELDRLAKALEKQKKGGQTGPFLFCEGMLPPTVLYIDTVFPGRLIWHTPGQQRQLYFKEHLTIDSGRYPIPPLLWCASAGGLHLHALLTEGRPEPKTVLQYAPFFNISGNGSVCMGTADAAIAKTSSVEAFIHSWQEAFFTSYFSHLNGGHQPVSGNVVQLWQSLLASRDPFPTDRLNPAGITFSQFITKQKRR